MGILNYIKERKLTFQNKLNDVRISKIKQDTKDLEQERLRQIELAKALKEKEKVENELKPIRNYNEQQKNDNKLLKLGNNLARYINKGKISSNKVSSRNIKKGLIRQINTKTNTLTLESENKNPFEITSSNKDPYGTKVKHRSPFNLDK